MATGLVGCPLAAKNGTIIKKAVAMETGPLTTPGENSCRWRMDTLRRQSDKLRRQLSTLYQTLQNDFRLKLDLPTSETRSGPEEQHKLQEEEQLIRNELTSIRHKLPFRLEHDQPTEVCKWRL